MFGREAQGSAQVQLGALLADMLTPEQYDENVATREASGDRVEFAIRLPGDEGGPVLLPIDSKFPLDDYQRLVDATERADLGEIDATGRKLESCAKRYCAKQISEKYLDPPRTTDFAIMFLPSEALYAEIARRTGLLEVVRREYRIAVVGPSTSQ